VVKLSYKAFLDEVKTKVDGLGADELRRLLYAWAKDLEYDERNWFLRNLAQHVNPKPHRLKIDTLFEQIEAFTLRVVNNEYSEGWGWDAAYGAEREWGDESWAQELDQFFRVGQLLARSGQNEAAIKVYKRLFDVLDLGRDAGLPGDPDLYNMLEVDLGEQLALFLRALYNTWSPQERPAQLLQAMRDYDEYGGAVGLQSIIECAESPLPEQDVFLADFLEYLRGQSGPSVVELTQETAQLLAGPAGPLELARIDPAKYADGYLTWLSFLESQGRKDEMLEVAREALNAIPVDLTARARVGEVLFKLGSDNGNYELMLEGLWACFAANPKLDYLVELYRIGLQTNQYRAIRQGVLRIVDELRQGGRMRPPQRWGVDDATLLTEQCFYHILVLSGDYAELFALAKGHGPLGRGGGTNPKHLLFLVLLFLLAPGKISSQILTELWEVALGGQRYGLGIDPVLTSKYLDVLRQVYAAAEPEAETKSDYVKWCVNEVNERVAAIISNKDRNGYPWAAKLVAALAVTLQKMGLPEDARTFVDGYHKQYSRYSAFRRELRAATLGEKENGA